jgi:arylformamidase
VSRIIDISQTIHPGMAIWPGDTEYKPFWVAQMENGMVCNIGSVTMSLHTGTHADAPFHFLPEGLTIADVDLSPYMGPVLVVDIAGVKSIDADAIAGIQAERVERIIFRTMSINADKFESSFAHITPDGAEALVARGIKLIGIDTPSVDQADSKTLDTHKILAEHSVAILENLSLEHVSPGTYELIALPLKLAGMDASPVRAILRTM